MHGPDGWWDLFPLCCGEVELILWKGSADNSGLTKDPCEESRFHSSICHKLVIPRKAIVVLFKPVLVNYSQGVTFFFLTLCSCIINQGSLFIPNRGCLSEWGFLIAVIWEADHIKFSNVRQSYCKDTLDTWSPAFKTVTCVVTSIQLSFFHQ